MSMTGLEVFDTTVHKTNHWLNEAMDELHWKDKHKAYDAFRSTLHALRDRLTVEETAQLAAQLPMLMRGFYYEGWDPTRKPERLRHRDEFLARIAQQFRNEAVDPEAVARAVFAVLSHHVSQGEIQDVRSIVPQEIRELWPES